MRIWFSWLRARTSDGFYWSTAINNWVQNRISYYLISWETISFSRKTVFLDNIEWVKCNEQLITFSGFAILSMISQRSINYWYGLNHYWTQLPSSLRTVQDHWMIGDLGWPNFGPDRQATAVKTQLTTSLPSLWGQHVMEYTVRESKPISNEHVALASTNSGDCS